MTRRRIVIRCFILGVVLGMFGFALVYPHTGSDGTAAAQVQTKPNIVVIMVDDMRADDLDGPMPATRKIIGAQDGHGASYERHYASASLCCPSRVTYLTGQPARRLAWPPGDATGLRRPAGDVPRQRPQRARVLRPVGADPGAAMIRILITCEGAPS
jgi:hypothetical protein